jgi:hypothetical protein
VRASAFLLSAFLCLAAVQGGVVHAQTTDPATTAAARSLFERGASAADAGDHATAADLLARSLALRSSPVVAFNLAQSLAQLGRLVEASETLVLAERGATNETLRAAAAELRAQIAARLAHVTVTVSPPDTDAEVRLDGSPLAAALRGTATPVDPGAHVATALREGVEVARVEVDVAEAQVADLPLVVPAVVVAPPPPDEVVIVEPIVEPPPSGDDTVLIAVLTTVGVLVVAGVGIGLGVGLSQQTPGPVEGNLSPRVVRFGP